MTLPTREEVVEEFGIEFPSICHDSFIPLDIKNDVKNWLNNTLTTRDTQIIQTCKEVLEKETLPTMTNSFDHGFNTAIELCIAKLDKLIKQL